MNALVLHFFRRVMLWLGHYGWTLNMRTGHDSYCWLQAKRIDLGMDYNGDVRQILIHEIAHIGTARFCNQKHNETFWRHAEELTRRFLGCELDENQRRHRAWTGGGIYALCYMQNPRVDGTADEQAKKEQGT